jgi:hypothetical protein
MRTFVREQGNRLEEPNWFRALDLKKSELLFGVDVTPFVLEKDRDKYKKSFMATGAEKGNGPDSQFVVKVKSDDEDDLFQSAYFRWMG